MHTLIGHEDWIRDIDVCQVNETQLLIVSCAQDCYIRVWKLSSIELADVALVVDDINNLSVESDKVDDIEDDDEDEINNNKTSEIKLKSTMFKLISKAKKVIEYTISLDSVLYGHEDWVYSVRWHPRLTAANGNGKQPLTFISSSIDKTIVMWKYDESNSLWLDMVRAGDIGGNTLGFFGALFDPAGDYIIAHGFQGALHAWKRSKNSENQVIDSGNRTV